MAKLDDDDAALAWAGDEPTRAEPTRAEPTPVVEPGPTLAGSDESRSDLAAVRVGSETRVVEVAPVAGKPQMPAALLVTYGILAGAYLIYTLGWLTSILRYNNPVLRPASPERLNAFMFGLGEILAILAPALWFAAVLLLTRGRKPLVRLVLLLVGLVVVVPWPFVLGAWQ